MVEAREQHRAELARTLAALAREAEERGDLDRAVDLTRRQVALDPLAEEANRELIRRVAASGDRGAALSAYARLNERFQRELHILPSRGTREVVALTRRADLTARRSARPGATRRERLPLPDPVARRARGRFVDRHEEFRQLHNAFGQAQRGERRLALVAGEAGIGKSRLVLEFGAAAHEAGASVLFGSCQAEAQLAYQAFAQALRHYATTRPLERLRDELPASAAELVVLLPELSNRIDMLASPLASDPSGERHRLFGAITDAFDALARTAPVVVLLEDLHWADAGTLQLLEHIVVEPEASPLLVVATYRDDEPGRRDDVRRGLLRLRRYPGTTSIRLDGLAETEVAKLIAGQFPDLQAAELAGRLRRRTAGNPFFIEVVLHAAVPGADGTALEAAIPARAIDLVEERLISLGKVARSLLGVAAVVGEDFDLQLVAAVGGVDEESALNVLDEAIHGRLIEEVPGMLGSYRFRHAIVREALYRSLTATRRAYLHREIGEALARSAISTAATVVYHLLAAGDLVPPDRVAAHLERAAREAMERRAYHQAAGLLERAADAIRGADAARRCDLLLKAGAAYRHAERPADTRPAYQAAARLARELGDARRLADAALGLCSVAFFPGTDPVDSLAVGLLEEALEGLGPDDVARRAHLYAQLARERYFVASPAETRATAERAVSIARHAGDPLALVAALDARHVSLAGRGDPHVRLGIADEMIEAAPVDIGAEYALRGPLWRVVDFLELGNVAAFHRERKWFERQAEHLRHPIHHWWPALWHATVAILAGNGPRGERLAVDALRVGEPSHGERAVVEHHAQMLWLRWQQGRLDELAPAADAFGAEQSTLPGIRAAAALAAHEAGSVERATQILTILTGDGLEWLAGDPNFLVTAAVLAELCARLGASATARAVYELLEPCRGRLVVSAYGSVCLGSVSGPLSLAAAAMGRRAEGKRLLQEAHATNLGIGAAAVQRRYEQWHGA